MPPGVFQTFVERGPICVTARAVLENLFQPERLGDLFERAARRQHRRTPLFSSVVALTQSVVLGVEPAVYSAHRKRRHTLKVSGQAVYGKLGGPEPGLSAALVGDSARQAGAVIDALGARREPRPPGYRVRVLGGNRLSAAGHRLEERRATRAAPLPGKVLAVLTPGTGLATDVFLTPDGHAQERSLLGEVLARARKGDVWIADRNFCTLKFLPEVAEKLGCFVVRQHGTVKGRPCGRRVFRGDGPTGAVYEQAVEFVREGRARKPRRVTAELPRATRDGDTSRHLLTNLPAKVPALKAAGLCRRRWTIETLFWEAAATRACEVDALCYPRAALFVFCPALVAANAAAAAKAAPRAARGEAADEVSGYYLALEVRQVHGGMMTAVPPPRWDALARPGPRALAGTLEGMAAHVDLERCRKSPRGPKRPPPKKSRYRNGGHGSAHKLLTGDDP